MSEQKIRGYCSQCSCYCPTISYVRDGKFVKVGPGNEHPNAVALCPKGLAGPELVYSKQRLQYPMRRTKPKGDPDPGWQRISWDEALDTIATRLNQIKDEWGAEAVAFARSGHSGSPMSEIDPWARRLSNAFGTPNNIATTHICQWHRDNCSGYTFGRPTPRGSQGRSEFERAGTILIWGNNTHATRTSLIPFIKRGLDLGAKLIVVDPRKIKMAEMADLWLQVCPGTDGALALSMINVMIEENLYDRGFVRDWTTAPLLVRGDTGDLLRASDLTDEGDSSNYVLADSVSQSPVAYVPATTPLVEPTLDIALNLKLAGGQRVECKTTFRLLRELVSEFPPNKAEKLTYVPEGKIRDAARMLAANRPASLYSWNGIEQSANASQTNRAICILYALTGDYDTPGGNVLYPKLPFNPIEGREFLSPEVRKTIGLEKHPLGTPATAGVTQAYEVYEAILHGKPYPIKALLSFGGNVIMSNAPSAVAREAVSKLDFHAHTELFLSPTAELADIVLPAASFWESWHVGVSANSVTAKAHVQLRPAVVAPQHESRPDLQIMAELAESLGLSDKFWNGDIEAGFNHQLAPSGITVEQLRMNPGGISIEMPIEYQKYSKKDDSGNFAGFSSPTRRIELYSQTFKDNGYHPLPVYEEPALRQSVEEYPLILIGAKVAEFCHSQHRALPSLRKKVPHPFLEINSEKAAELDIKDGDWVRLETPDGSLTLKAKVTDGILYDVVCTQNGWWQGCPELNLPGYDPFSSEGANANLVYSTDKVDPVSGCVPMKGYPCRVRKKS